VPETNRDENVMGGLRVSRFNRDENVMGGLRGSRFNRGEELMGDLRGSKFNRDEELMGSERGSRFNRVEDVMGGERGCRFNRDEILTSATINNSPKWRMVELEDGFLILTDLTGTCLETNKNGEVNESDCELENEYQLWQVNGENLLNIATTKCLDLEDENNFKLIECD